MSALSDTPVSETRKASDPEIISRPIASSSPRPATPPLPASTSSVTSEEDEIDKNSVINTSKPNAAPPPPVPEISETLQILNMNTFRQQILDLDEEDDHEFSHSMVETYFLQAEETFRKLDKNFTAKDLSELSTLGHFFKGSSAAFGLEKVQASCEKIQNYGLKRDEKAGKDLESKEALDKIRNQLAQLREEYAEAKQTLEDWFREHEDEHEDED